MSADDFAAWSERLWLPCTRIACVGARPTNGWGDSAVARVTAMSYLADPGSIGQVYGVRTNLGGAWSWELEPALESQDPLIAAEAMAEAPVSIRWITARLADGYPVVGDAITVALYLDGSPLLDIEGVAVTLTIPAGNVAAAPRCGGWIPGLAAGARLPAGYTVGGSATTPGQTLRIIVWY